MTVVTAAILGITAVLLAAQFKSVKGEYAVFLVAGAGLMICVYGVSRLETVMETFEKVRSCIQIDRIYLDTLMRMVGIAYIAEFSSGICKDAGYGALGNQIEVFGKLSILAVSMPILLALMETVQGFLS